MYVYYVYIVCYNVRCDTLCIVDRSCCQGSIALGLMLGPVVGAVSALAFC